MCVFVRAHVAIFNPIPTAKIHDTQIYLVRLVVATAAAAAVARAAAHFSSFTGKEFHCCFSLR